MITREESRAHDTLHETPKAFQPLKAIAVLGGIQAAAMVFNLVRSKIAAIAVGPPGVGAMSLIDQVVSLVAQVAAFSLPVAGVKFLSAAHSSNREEFETLYGAFVRALTLLSSVAALAGVALLMVAPEILGAELAQFRTAAIWGLLAIPATNLTVLITNTMASARRASASGLYGLATAVAAAALCGAGVLMAGVRGYYFANFVGIATIATGGMVYLFRRERLRSRRGGWSELRRRGILTFSATMYVTSFTAPLSDLLVRYAVLSAGGLVTTGLFQAAAGLGFIVRNVARPSFGLFLTPALNRNRPAGEKLQEAAAFLRTLALLAGACAVALVLFPKWFLLILYARAFESAASAVYLFVAGVCLQLFASVNVALLLGLGDTRGFVGASVAADLATAAFAWWLAPHLGIVGVALAFVLDGSTAFVLSALWLGARHGLGLMRAIGWLPPAVLLAIGAAGVLGRCPAAEGLWGGTAKVAVWLLFVINCSRFVPGGVRGFSMARRDRTVGEG